MKGMTVEDLAILMDGKNGEMPEGDEGDVVEMQGDVDDLDDLMASLVMTEGNVGTPGEGEYASMDFTYTAEDDEGNEFYPVSERYYEAIKNPEKTTIDKKFLEGIKTFTRGGKEYYGLPKSEHKFLLPEEQRYLDKSNIILNFESGEYNPGGGSIKGLEEFGRRESPPEDMVSAYRRYMMGKEGDGGDLLAE